MHNCTIGARDQKGAKAAADITSEAIMVIQGHIQGALDYAGGEEGRSVGQPERC